MGLDMYLERQTYVENWDHMAPEARHEFRITKGGQPADVDPAKIKYIVEEAGYWRKANAIHQWFVDHVQNGTDDCHRYYVSHEQLKALRTLCTRVLACPDKAAELLPTQDGFFFGDTSYDEAYMDDLRATVKMLDAILDRERDDGSYYYQASW